MGGKLRVIPQEPKELDLMIGRTEAEPHNLVVSPVQEPLGHASPICLSQSEP